MRQLLFTDLDDTLLTRKKELSRGNAEAIHQALDAGHLFAVNSGRPLPGVIPLLQNAGLTREGCYAITCNGGLIYDLHRQQILYRKSLPLSSVRQIFQTADAHGLYCQTYSDTALLCREYTAETAFYCAGNGMSWHADPALPNSLSEEPVKVLVIHLTDHARLEAYRRDLTARTEGTLSLFFSNDFYLEHVAHGISKGEAIRFLCRHLQLPPEQTLAVGDAENDISMLLSAHIGVAVHNAADTVKDAADYVTAADCDHDAIREVIHQFMIF